MKVRGLAKTTEGGTTRVSASVSWEDCDRPDRTIFIATDDRFADDVEPSADAFLLATFVPALHHGERRVSIEGAVCPRLRNGLVTAAQLFRRWYADDTDGLALIEPTQGFRPSEPRAPARQASFFSGGVDAMATLRSNRLDFPLTHPAAIRDCLFVHGMDVGGYEHLPANREHVTLAHASLGPFAERVETTLVPVRTNFRHLDDSDLFFNHKYYGSLMAAVAHAFSRRISSVMIASGMCVHDLLESSGSHPLLDSNFGSCALRVEYDGLRYSRLDKVRLIADWDEALRSLRSCFDPFRSAEALNCGACEKCLRTMTELLVCGALRRCPSYPPDDVTPDALRALVANPKEIPGAWESRESAIAVACRSLNSANIAYWQELVEPLTRLGRRDLIDVLVPKLAAFRKLQEWKDGTDWKGRVKRLDRRYLRGTMLQGIRGVEGIIARARRRRETR